MATEINRQDIISCLNNWQISYKITNNEGTLNKSMGELIGESKLSWFNYSELNDFENNDETTQLGYDAKQELINLFALKNNLNLNNNETWDTIRWRVFNSFINSFKGDIHNIIGQTDPSVRRDKALQFIIKCEKCYEFTKNIAFVDHARQAKSIDAQLNNWIQARAHKETNYINHPEIDKISENFINLISDPKAETIPAPITYFIEQQDNSNKGKLKVLYLKHGWQIHLSAMAIFGSLFYLLFSDNESLWLIECLLAIALINLLIWFSFKLFYQERVDNSNPPKKDPSV